jgi:hypothetical protein
MTKDQTNNKRQIQMAVRATFLTTLVPTDIELGTTVETPTPPLAKPDESSFEENGGLSQSLPLVEHKESLVETQDEIADWVREARASMVRTLELSKRLDDLLALHISWFRDDAVGKKDSGQI